MTYKGHFAFFFLDDDRQLKKTLRSKDQLERAQADSRDVFWSLQLIYQSISTPKAHFCIEEGSENRLPDTCTQNGHEFPGFTGFQI